MKTIRTAVIAAFGFVLLASASPAQTPGVSLWTGDQLREIGKRLPQKMGTSRSASEPLANLGDHAFQLAYRDASGEGEIHEQFTDVFVIQAGEATLAVGGRLVDGKKTAAGELRGPSLADAQLKALAPGDVVNIPAGTPHQLLLKDGKSLTYLVLKIRSHQGGGL